MGIVNISGNFKKERKKRKEKEGRKKEKKEYGNQIKSWHKY